MFPLLIGIAAAAGIGGLLFSKEKHPSGAEEGHPVPGFKTLGLAPPGTPQPTGILVSLPPVLDVSNALHDAAAKVVQRLITMGQTPTEPVTEVLYFQSEYNKTNPPVPLLTDGKYSAKTHAVLQSIITPAIAPAAIGSGVPVVIPAVTTPTPDPELSSDIVKAANVLLSFFKAGGKRGTFKAVSTFQNAWNAHHLNSPVVVDGLYGENCEAALQSVLNWIAQGGPAVKAPVNAYGSVTKLIPLYRP